MKERTRLALMNPARRRAGAAFVLAMACVAAARAKGDEDACHQVAASLSTTPDMYAAMCSDKDDLVRVCENQVKKMGPDSSENYLVRYFITPNAPCKGQQSLRSFCGFVQSYDGYQILAEDGALVPDPSDPDYANLTRPRERAAKVCGTTPEAIRVALCSKADAAKQWRFALAQCPTEGRAIHMRECLKPYVTDGEGAGRVMRRTEAECAAQYKSRTK